MSNSDSTLEITNPQPLEPFGWRAECGSLLRLSGPLMISQLAQSGMGVADTLMAGRHSATSLAGVAVGASLWTPVFLALSGTLIALSPLFARTFSANERTATKSIFQHSLWILLILAPLAILLLQQSSKLFSLLGVDERAHTQASGYLDALCWALPAIGLIQILRSINEGTLQTRQYMLVSLAAFFCNIPLNYLLIYGSWGIPELGGIGCGWATTLVLWIQVVILWVLTQKNSRLASLQLFRHWRPPQVDKMLQLLALGLPIGLTLLAETSMFSMISLFIAKLGSTAVSGHQVAFSAVSVAFMLPLSLSTAVSLRCGFHLGCEHADLARHCWRLGITLALIFASLSSLVIALLPRQIAALYSPTIEIQDVAVELLLIAGLLHSLDALQVTTAAALRSYQDTRYTLWIMLLVSWGIALPLGYTLGMTNLFTPAMGPKGFWVGLICGLAVGFVLLLARLHFFTSHPQRFRDPARV